MMDYSEYRCIYCDEYTVIYHQYIEDGCCESCGEWQEKCETSDCEKYPED